MYLHPERRPPREIPTWRQTLILFVLVALFFMGAGRL